MATLPPHLQNLPENHPLRRRFAEPAPPTPQQLAAQYSDQIDRWLDSVARDMQYRDIVSAVTYVDDVNPKFAAEAQALKDWRSNVWTSASVLMVEIMTGQRPIPENFDALKALLPQFVAPTIV